MKKCENYKDVATIAIKVLNAKGVEEINISQYFMLQKDCQSLIGKTETYVKNYFNNYDVHKYLLCYD